MHKTEIITELLRLFYYNRLMSEVGCGRVTGRVTDRIWNSYIRLYSLLSDTGCGRVSWSSDCKNLEMGNEND